MAKRRRFTAEFKSKVALEALRGDKTVQELSAKHQIHPNQISQWKRQASDGLSSVFEGKQERQQRDVDAEIKDLHAKIGELTVINDFLAKGLKK